MINFETIKKGDKVRVVGNGAPGFALLGDELEIVSVGKNRVDAKNKHGEIAFFALTCGAARLELIHFKYRPSNGTEGEVFCNKFCARCEEEETCHIPSQARAFDTREPEYPKQWVYDAENKPTCTSFSLYTIPRMDW